MIAQLAERHRQVMDVKVKICGITNLKDAIAAVEYGADYLGFIFYSRSKRFVETETAKAIATKLRKDPACPHLVGVFVLSLIHI